MNLKKEIVFTPNEEIVSIKEWKMQSIRVIAEGKLDENIELCNAILHKLNNLLDGATLIDDKTIEINGVCKIEDIDLSHEEIDEITDYLTYAIGYRLSELDYSLDYNIEYKYAPISDMPDGSNRKNTIRLSGEYMQIESEEVYGNGLDTESFLIWGFESIKVKILECDDFNAEYEREVLFKLNNVFCGAELVNDKSFMIKGFDDFSLITSSDEEFQEALTNVMLRICLRLCEVKCNVSYTIEYVIKALDDVDEMTDKESEGN